MSNTQNIIEKKPVTIAVIGAGLRGAVSYASYERLHGNEVKIVGVAEPQKTRKENFIKEHKIPTDKAWDSWKGLLSVPKFADAVIVATQDDMHLAPAVKAMELGYHVLLEKPMSNKLDDCFELASAAKKYNRVLAICHVLRYTTICAKIKEIIQNGELGELVTIQHSEFVGSFHQAHSFVRGNWGNSKKSSPMILAKCCHDMDLLTWFANSKAKTIQSFGSLKHFNAKNAPKGAPERCTDGCPVQNECPYYAPKQYLSDNIGWPTNAITNDLSFEGRLKALKEGPYGRCVYKCDNDVVDNQTVNICFENGVTATHLMTAFSLDCNRKTRVLGTKAELFADFNKNQIIIKDFTRNEKKTLDLTRDASGHGGGDAGIMRAFVKQISDAVYGSKGDASVNIETSVDKSLESHLMSFAAEKSRVNNELIDMATFKG